MKKLKLNVTNIFDDSINLNTEVYSVDNYGWNGKHYSVTMKLSKAQNAKIRDLVSCDVEEKLIVESKLFYSDDASYDADNATITVTVEFAYDDLKKIFDKNIDPYL